MEGSAVRFWKDMWTWEKSWKGWVLEEDMGRT